MDDDGLKYDARRGVERGGYVTIRFRSRELELSSSMTRTAIQACSNTTDRTSNVRETRCNSRTVAVSLPTTLVPPRPPHPRWPSSRTPTRPTVKQPNRSHSSAEAPARHPHPRHITQHRARR